MPDVRLPVLPTLAAGVDVFTDAEGKKRAGGALPTGHLGFAVTHPTRGKAHGVGTVPVAFVRLLDDIRLRDTYIGQFELVAALTPFLSLPREWFEGRPVTLWIDNSSAIGSLIKGYSGKPDCARIVNMFHFVFAQLGAASLYIDYVPTESNPADIPSRFHEMSYDERRAAADDLGTLVPMVVPSFVHDDGSWLSYTEIARSIWG